MPNWPPGSQLSPELGQLGPMQPMLPQAPGARRVGEVHQLGIAQSKTFKPPDVVSLKFPSNGGGEIAMLLFFG